MAKDHVCPCSVGCPLQKAMNAIGGRWKMSILCSLSNDGPIKRTEYLEIPVRVEYEITDSVRTLIPILTELAMWGNEHFTANKN